MTAFSYAQGTAKIAPLFQKIHAVGVPTGKIDKVWLAQLGFSASNDARLISVLKQVNFIDSSHVPTETWKKYKAANAIERKQVLSQGIREGYAELFAFYSDANSRTDAEIESFFRGHVSAGSQVLNKTIQTFRALVTIADFTSAPMTSGTVPEIKGGDPDPGQATAPKPLTGHSAAMSVVINIQLAVPETQDARVYDAFFESLKKHLLT